MNDPLPLLLAGAAGLVLGAIFFGGLWWTVRKGLLSRQSALWFFGSMLLRMGIALAGFYFIGRGDWRRIISCLLGFVVARFVVTWLSRAPANDHHSRTPEASHAP
jgi:F1F0 ATPase subunit 2